MCWRFASPGLTVLTRTQHVTWHWQTRLLIGSPRSALVLDTLPALLIPRESVTRSNGFVCITVVDMHFTVPCCALWTHCRRVCLMLTVPVVPIPLSCRCVCGCPVLCAVFIVFPLLWPSPAAPVCLSNRVLYPLLSVATTLYLVTVGVAMVNTGSLETQCTGMCSCGPTTPPWVRWFTARCILLLCGSLFGFQQW